MMRALDQRIRLTDLAPAIGDARTEFLAGLRERPKRIDPKFFYDERGAILFDRICELEDYYLTRTEMQIIRENLDEITRECGQRCLLVELGSGSSMKTQLLLNHLDDPVGYVPIDISRTHLLEAAERLAENHPGLELLPVCADFAQPLRWPEPRRRPLQTMLFYPGSTIGNFRPNDARRFLQRLAHACRPGCRMMVGVDLVKEAAIVHAAYNDREGVTAEFNLNLLHRANREFGTNFRIEQFAHEALYNSALTRVEMWLVSRRQQVVDFGEVTIGFARDERILTEYSYKYTPSGFTALAALAGWRTISQWKDARGWFGIFVLEVAGSQSA